MSRTKAIGLISGGLDSVLAAALLLKQNVEVIGILINTGFTDHLQPSGEGLTVQDIADEMGFELRVVDIRDEYWQTLLYPQFGYGKNINPCLDCHLHMTQVAARIMHEENADCVFTGEVVGQRPKSQLAHQMKITVEKSGIAGRLLRPLSALLLEETIPETEGKIDRSQLKGFIGRGRSAQLALAKELGVEHLAVAAGGNCLLTNKEYARKFNDIVDQYGKENFPREDVDLLKFARHFRISPEAKIIISRNEREHDRLLKLKSRYISFELPDVVGAMAIGQGKFNEDDKISVAKLLTRYSKAEAGDEIKMVCDDDGNKSECTVICIENDDPMINRLRI